MKSARRQSQRKADELMLFLGGDVMTGRGIDQALEHPSDWQIFETYVQDARDYVALAEQASGKIATPVSAAHIWGDGLQTLAQHAPDVSIVNLETSVTVSDAHWPSKGIHYRMHPANINCLQTAPIDCCVLANNHVVDWGFAGLLETVAVLREAGIVTAGAGANRVAASAPAVIDLVDGGRVLVFAYGLPSSGIPQQWMAADDQPGVNILLSTSMAAADEVIAAVKEFRDAGDIVIVSLHWGGNWGYQIPQTHIEFAHALVESGLINVIHGHSSHHPIAIEIYRGTPILYGCGDLINDYEGIRGYEKYRANLALMYWLRLHKTTGKLQSFTMTPLMIEKLKLNQTTEADADWLAHTLTVASQSFSTRVVRGEGTDLNVDLSGVA